MDETAQELRGILKKHLPKLNGDELTPEDALVDLGIDSLGAVEMVFDIESEFGIEIPDEKLTSLKTVGDVLSVVADRKCAGGREQ